MHLENGIQQRSRQENMNYWQIDPLDADAFLLAALVEEEATTSYLYPFQLADEKQIQLGKDEVCC